LIHSLWASQQWAPQFSTRVAAVSCFSILQIAASTEQQSAIDFNHSNGNFIFCERQSFFHFKNSNDSTNVTSLILKMFDTERQIST
jgi:hypothetical protein